MTRAISLRLRLTAIILLPLLTIAMGVGLWQLNNARNTAADVFDRSLLSAALAVANDVAISGGDALSDRTRDILTSTSGGPVFYHVYAPDGVIVAGYATPPAGIPRTGEEVAVPTYFDAVYLDTAVSGVRLQTRTEIDGFAGIFTTTVWQDQQVRSAFVQALVLRSFITISALIASLALLVWFGISYGLRPLLDLEQAIEQRSERELSPIQRAVPKEVEGIVQVLNMLFGQVSRSLTAQSEFVANAAHQLRNPIAGVLALAEAVHNAPNDAARKERSADLLEAARKTADLGQKLLVLERAEAISPRAGHARFDLAAALSEWIDDVRSKLPERVQLSLNLPTRPTEIVGDATMLKEAVLNLLTNSILHGGAHLTQIEVTLKPYADHVDLTIADDGLGIAENQLSKARERFALLADTSSSGLGLSIVDAVAGGHGGSLALQNANPGLIATLRLPSATAA